jgi:hypothetical protein
MRDSLGTQAPVRVSRHYYRDTTADTANVIIRPPIAWALAVLAALALQWLMPLPFMPAAVSAGWVGGAVFAIALALDIGRRGLQVPPCEQRTSSGGGPPVAVGPI